MPDARLAACLQLLLQAFAAAERFNLPLLRHSVRSVHTGTAAVRLARRSFPVLLQRGNVQVVPAACKHKRLVTDFGQECALGTQGHELRS